MSSSSVSSMKLDQNLSQNEPKTEDSSSYLKKALNASLPYLGSAAAYSAFTYFRVLMSQVTTDKLGVGDGITNLDALKGLGVGLITYDVLSRISNVFIDALPESIQNKLKETKIPGLPLNLWAPLQLTKFVASTFAACEITKLTGYETSATSIFSGNVVATSLMLGMFGLLMYDQGGIYTLNLSNVKQEILESPKPVVLMATSNWALKNNEILSNLKELHKEYKGQIKFVRVHVDGVNWSDELPEVKSLPTLYFYQNGKLLGENVGFIERENLKNLIDQTFQKEAESVKE